MTSTSLAPSSFKYTQTIYIFGQAITYLAAAVFLLTYDKTTYFMQFLGHYLLAATILFALAPFVSFLMKMATELDGLLLSGVFNITIVSFLSSLLGSPNERIIILCLLILYYWVLLFVAYNVFHLIKIINGRRRRNIYPRSRYIREKKHASNTFILIYILSTCAGFLSFYTEICQPFHFFAISMFAILLILIIDPKYSHAG